MPVFMITTQSSDRAAPPDPPGGRAGRLSTVLQKTGALPITCMTMAGPRSTPMDPTNVRFRLRSIVVGSWLTIGTVAVFLAYFLATWERPHRPFLVVLALAAGASSAGMRWVPLERVVRSRWR